VADPKASAAERSRAARLLRDPRTRAGALGPSSELVRKLDRVRDRTAYEFATGRKPPPSPRSEPTKAPNARSAAARSAARPAANRAASSLLPGGRRFATAAVKKVPVIGTAASAAINVTQDGAVKGTARTVGGAAGGVAGAAVGGALCGAASATVVGAAACPFLVGGGGVVGGFVGDKVGGFVGDVMDDPKKTYDKAKETVSDAVSAVNPFD